MRLFSYRNRRRLRGALLLLLALCLLAAVLLILRFKYLERHLVYTQKGAYFSYEAPSLQETAPEESEPEAPIPVQIVYVSPEEALAPALRQVTGVYISCADLSDMDAVRGALETVLAEPGPHAVLLELKSGAGRYYYHSALGESANVDLTAIEGLIRSLKENPDVYLMASVPAFSDSAFALANQTEGLPISGGALWMDYDANYWLDPASELVRTHLVSEAQELAALGFSEIIFTGFQFPDSQNIVYNSEADRSALVSETAQAVCDAMAGTEISLSFQTEDPAFVLPEAAARIALDGIDGASAAMQASQYTEDPVRVLFFTDSHDTRFTAYSVLRPLLERGEES